MATATVTSGLSPAFASGDTVTPAKLNSLGTPTVSVTIDNSEVTTAKIADSAITSVKIADATSTTTGVTNAKMRHSSALSVIGRTADTDGAPADIVASTDNHVLRRSGTSIGFGTIGADGIAAGAVTPAKLSQPLTFDTAKASTSGTSVDFSSIPSWVRRITVAFSGVSVSGTSIPLVQIGVGGSPTTSGYTAGTVALSSTASTQSTSTQGFPVFANLASYALHGALSLVNVSGNLWVASGVFYNVATTTYAAPVAGSVTLSGVLNMVRVTTVNGTDTFDAGTINICYE